MTMNEAVNSPRFHHQWKPDSIRIENRVVGMDCNPYLAIAASLACGYLGIKKISFPKIKYSKLSSGEDFAQETSFEIEKASFTPSPSNLEMLPLNVVLASIGQKSLIVDLKHKLKIFGFHFASLDIRQDSRVHKQVFEEIFSHPDIREYVHGLPENFNKLDTSSRHKVLTSLKGDVPSDIFETTITKETLESIRAMRVIQERNGERGCNRYIISNCQSIDNILELFALHKICNWSEPTVDIIPLFETIPDLEVCERIMQTLYENDQYRKHLSYRGNKQTVMLGFSDGTKDGGYFMANWAIFKAKEALTSVSKQHNIDVVFFDGRGGPPARGGGKTHQFYASLGPTIQDKEVQLTIQGQTISSNFGTPDSSKYNLEQLISSGLSNKLLSDNNTGFTKEERHTMNALAKCSYKAYQDFKSHPKFIPYLERISTTYNNNKKTKFSEWDSLMEYVATPQGSILNPFRRPELKSEEKQIMNAEINYTCVDPKHDTDQTPQKRFLVSSYKNS